MKLREFRRTTLLVIMIFLQERIYGTDNLAHVETNI